MKGVSGHDLIYRHGITRAAAIVFDLRADGFDIETIDGKTLDDGRKELASYRLKVPMRTLRATPPDRGLFDDLPVPDAPVMFDCGCQRSSDGRSWTVRCASHGNAPKESLSW